MSTIQESISADEKWADLNRQALEYAKHFEWGLYTNTQLEMADLLKKEGKHKHELELLFWVLYLDINGPENRRDVPSDLFKEFPPFDTGMAIVPPAIAKRSAFLLAELDLDADVARSMFIQCATRRRNKLMPVPPDRAWDDLQKHLFTNYSHEMHTSVKG